MSKPFEADVIDNFSPALRLLNDRVKKIAGQIKVGVKNDQHANSKLTVAQIGQIHESGAPKRNIPARPFLSPAVRNNATKYIRFIGTQIAPMLLGRTNSGEIMDDIGAMAVQDVQQYIENGNFAPLKPATIKRKGHSKPLIDTGQLKRSIVANREGGRDDALSWRGM